MALNTFKCDYLTPLPFKGLMHWTYQKLYSVMFCAENLVFSMRNLLLETNYYVISVNIWLSKHAGRQMTANTYCSEDKHWWRYGCTVPLCLFYDIGRMLVFVSHYTSLSTCITSQERVLKYSVQEFPVTCLFCCYCTMWKLGLQID